MIIDIQNKAKGLFTELGYPLKKDEGWQYLRQPLTALPKADLKNLIQSIDPLEFSLKS